MKKYKVIFIDWDKTLSISKFWGHLNHSNQPLAEKLQTSLFVNLKPLINPWMRGEFTSEEIMRRVSSDSKIGFNKALLEFTKSCKSMKLVSDEIYALTSRLRSSGIKVVIATDNMDSFTRWTIPSLRLEDKFDAILNSFDLRALKKDTDNKGNSLFFKTFLEKHRILKGESLLVDDGDEKRKFRDFGIEYRKIEPVVGLVPELKRVITQLQ